MSLRYALLALLSGRPMTGYDLAKAARTTVGYVWHAPDSQIYPELRRMEADGLLAGTQVPWGKTAVKRQYRITPHGRRAFRDWLEAPVDYARERNVPHLKAAYLEWADPAAARAMLHGHIAHHQALLEQWMTIVTTIQDGSNALLAERLAGQGDREIRRISAYKIFAYEGLAGQARAQIAWARRGLKLVAELEDASAGPLSEHPAARPSKHPAVD